jgi:hypothetical protein
MKMKRILALAALLALMVPSISHAQAFIWQDLKFPAVGAYGGNGAYGDTSFFSMTGATVTTTLYSDNAGTQDTCKAFSLTNWVPAPVGWTTADTVYATSGTLGTSAAHGKAVFTKADSIFCFVVAVGPKASINQSGELGDSLLVVLQGSVDGQAWNTLGPAQGQGIAEIGTGNSWFYSFHTTAAQRPSQGSPQIMFWPLLRLRFIGDQSGGATGNGGQFTAKVGYFASQTPLMDRR